MEMNRGPLVSVGVPTYNRPEGLKRAVESLINQTYSNLEIIISDNCSSNINVQGILSEFAHDNRVKIYKQEVNRGATFNFNFPLTKTTGDYFMWLADDDWLDLNYI